MNRVGAEALACALFALLLISPSTVFAYDQNISYNFAANPTVSVQALQQAITQLAGQTSSPDPQLQALANQLLQSLGSGNLAAEQAALSKLEAYPNLASEAPALSALLKSLSLNSNGTPSLNVGQLGSLLGADTPNSSGVPSALSSVSPQLALDNMNTLISLLNSLAGTSLGGGLLTKLLTSENQMSLSFPNLQRMNLPSPPGQGPGSLPGLGQTPLAAPAVGPVGEFSPAQAIRYLAVPVILAAAAIALFVFRKRVRTLFSGQTLPVGPAVLEVEEVSGELTPRKRVIRAFNRVLVTMHSKGVTRERSETHREFSQRCVPLPEGPKVKSVSMRFETAKFSLAEVSEHDAAAAEEDASALERTTAAK